MKFQFKPEMFRIRYETSPYPTHEKWAASEAQRILDEHLKALADVRAKDAASVASLAAAAKSLTEIGLLNDAQRLAGAAMQAAQAFVGDIDDAGGEPADGPGPVQPMGGPPGDEGLPGLPFAPPGLADGGMGGPDDIGPGSPDGGMALPSPSEFDA